MKNTVKKIFSMLLAVIVLLSVMSFSFSAGAKLSVAGQDCVYAYIKMRSYERNIYEHGGHIGGVPEFVEKISIDAISEVESYYPDFDILSYEYMTDSANSQSISEITQIFKSANENIETFLQEEGITVVIDIYEYFKCGASMEMIYSDEELNKVDKALKSEECAEAFDIYNEADELYRHGEFKTQAEFDAFWKQACCFFDKLISCLDGNHPYGEYISNNDATEEADGTKTATCEFCGAADTVTDEGSKLVSDKNCSCNCHESGFMGFIWKILSFFYKLFGTNKTCSCGAVHY